MYLYCAVRQKLFAPGVGFYRSFGLLALCLRPGCRHRVGFVPDISPDIKFAVALAARCTVGQLDPRQLQDVAEDALQ